jgi:HlyD family secretion protein
MKKLTLVILVLVAIGAGLGAYYRLNGKQEPQVTTQAISRGDIVQTVGATGTLQAVTTVQVGTQVSGTVSWLGADFNSIVKKGQVVARLDPALLQTQLETARANHARAQADLERLRVALQDAKTKMDRAHELAEKQLITKADLETADVNYQQAQAQIKSQQAQVEQAKTAVDNAQVNLDHTVITAPIDGIVISRNVDVGQTVAASMQAPTLFIIAADLTKMQVNANIDESDVGNIRPDQQVTFRVDAYPNETFTGTVGQVRLNPQTVQNVVTYSTVINVPNQQLKLKPGMTANVNIEIARRSNVMRVPNAALRFRPTPETFAALNQPITPDIQRALGGGRGGFGGGQGGGVGGRNGGGRNAESGQPGQPAAANAPSAPGSQKPAAKNGAGRGGQQSAQNQTQGQGQGSPGFQRGGGDFSQLTPEQQEERRRRFEERMANMTPEERQQMMERFRNRQGGAPGGNRSAGPGGATQPGRANANQPGRAGQPGTQSAQTIDSLFGPLPRVEGRGRVWLYINKQLKPVSVRTGISDGTWTEVLDDNELQPNTEVVTNIITGLESTTNRPAGGGNPNANNPLMPQRGGPGRGR